jgi:hypothetical protein
VRKKSRGVVEWDVIVDEWDFTKPHDGKVSPETGIKSDKNKVETFASGPSLGLQNYTVKLPNVNVEMIARGAAVVHLALGAERSVIHGPNGCGAREHNIAVSIAHISSRGDVATGNAQASARKH